MKTNSKILALILLLVLLTGACTKEGLRGPAGPAGTEGIPGPKGDQGLDGMGNANVLKYTFSVEEAQWEAKNLGGTNDVLAYDIKPEDINNVDLNDEEYVIFAYAKPDNVNYPQRKVLPFSYNINTSANAIVRIDLVLGDTDTSPMITASKQVVTGTTYTQGAPAPADMLTKITFDIFLIKLTDLAAVGSLGVNLQYNDLNKVYQQRN